MTLVRNKRVHSGHLRGPGPGTCPDGTLFEADWSGSDSRT
jgi:hypothetical protein